MKRFLGLMVLGIFLVLMIGCWKGKLITFTTYTDQHTNGVQPLR